MYVGAIKLVILFQLAVRSQELVEKVEPVQRGRLQNALLQQLVISCNDWSVYKQR